MQTRKSQAGTCQLLPDDDSDDDDNNNNNNK